MTVASENKCTVQLEERECANGCGIKFSVMPTSTQTVARADCEKRCFNVRSACKKARNRVDLDHRKVAKNRMEKCQREIDKWKGDLWNNCLKSAKLLKEAKDVHAGMDLAQYAEAAASVTGKNLTTFALELEYDEQHLKNLVDMYQVFKHLSCTDADLLDYDLLAELLAACGRDATKAGVVKTFHKLLKLKNADRFDNYVIYAKQMKAMICDPLLDLKIALDQSQLKVFHRDIKDIYKKLDAWQRTKNQRL